MSKKLLPTNDRILLKPIDEGEQTYGSIVIPDMGKEKPEMGQVLAIGPGAWTATGVINHVRSCKVGDLVLVPKIGTLRIDFEGEEYYIASDREVLAVVEQDTELGHEED